MSILRVITSPIRAVELTLGSFRPSAMPVMVRRNYRHELIAAFTIPFVLAVAESTIIGVFIKNAFEDQISERVLNFVVAIVTASNAAANVLSFVWARLSHGRDKVAFVTGLQLVIIAMIALVAAVPQSPLGLGLLVAAVLGARLCWSGFITIRSTIWRQNYDRSVRARITGKLATIQVTMVAMLGFLLGDALDQDETLFRFFFPIGCGVALLGIWSWSRIRVRGHTSLLRGERDGDKNESPSFNPLSIVRTLAADRPFARFMACMFTLGLGNLMVSAPLVVVLRDEFQFGYKGGISITSSIPMAVMPLSIPLWGRLLDRVHVVQFRAIHSWFFVGSSLLLLAATLMHERSLLFAAVTLQGLAFGGGVLAWNLGHLDFAPPEKASQYMSVHVTLTGVRGMIAPFVGMALYEWFRGISSGAGGLVFAVAAALSAAGGLGFVMLTRTIREPRDHRGQPIDTTPPSRAGI